MGPKRALSAEEIEARKKRRAEQARRRYAAKCGSERELLLARKREAQRRRMECASERERLLARKREAARRRMECPTEHERVLAQRREAKRRRVAMMSPEERSERLAHKRELQRRRSDAARQQRIWAAFPSVSVYCSTHRTPPVESTTAVQTEATECISGRMDVAVGTTIVDRGVCQSTQTLPAAQRVHKWADTTDLDVHDNGPYVQGISGSIGVAW